MLEHTIHSFIPVLQNFSHFHRIKHIDVQLCSKIKNDDLLVMTLMMIKMMVMLAVKYIVRLLNTAHIHREDDRSGKEAMVNYGIWQKSTDTRT